MDESDMQRPEESDLTFNELLERTAELERADEKKKALVSLLSHDLRIPLSLISGFAGALKQHWEVLSEEKRLEAVDVIHRNSKRLASMLEEGFEIVTAEVGGLSFEIAPFDLGDLAKTVAQDFGTDDIPLEVDVPSNLSLARGDSRRTWRVVANLVTNAIKYGGGRPVKLEVKDSGQEIQVSVIDQGSGIEASDLEHLFEKNYRVAEAEESGAAGLGMGLYICKILIEGQGGRIWAQSKRFEGSTFTFTLPVAGREPLDEGAIHKAGGENRANGSPNKPRTGSPHRDAPRAAG